MMRPKEAAVFQEKRCVPILTVMDKLTQFGPMWVLGMPFFRHYYTTFSMSRKEEDEYTKELRVVPVAGDCTPQASSLLQTGEAPGAAQQRAPLLQVKPSKVVGPRWAGEPGDLVNL